MESVKRRTMKRTAEAAAEMVRQAVVAEDDIKSPASLLSEYDSGPGPSLSWSAAWQVDPVGNDRFVLNPHPKVRQRAIVLNFGYSGDITPNQADVLKFNVNGVPMYRESVSGPDATGYWQAAFQRMRSSDKLERIATGELQREIEVNEVF